VVARSGERSRASNAGKKNINPMYKRVLLNNKGV
jgi:hypothetical protein